MIWLKEKMSDFSHFEARFQLRMTKMTWIWASESRLLLVSCILNLIAF